MPHTAPEETSKAAERNALRLIITLPPIVPIWCDEFHNVPDSSSPSIGQTLPGCFAQFVFNVMRNTECLRSYFPTASREDNKFFFVQFRYVLMILMTGFSESFQVCFGYSIPTNSSPAGQELFPLPYCPFCNVSPRECMVLISSKRSFGVT